MYSTTLLRRLESKPEILPCPIVPVLNSSLQSGFPDRPFNGRVRTLYTEKVQYRKIKRLKRLKSRIRVRMKTQHKSNCVSYVYGSSDIYIFLQLSVARRIMQMQESAIVHDREGDAKV